MSEILDTNIELKQIKAPSLTSTEYGKDIREQFDNIDENFRRVSNHDYIEGKSGANINVADLSLYDTVNKQFTELGKKLLNVIADYTYDWNVTLTWTYQNWVDSAIDNRLRPVEYTDDNGTHTIRFYEYLFQNPNISVFYTLIDVEAEDNEQNRKYICSPQVYTFLDQRYANVEELGGINKAVFDSNLEDTSCLLTLKYENSNPTFTRSNLFPTLYYDSNSNEFKWKVYNNETGIRAQGPKGDSGSSTSLWIVQVANVDDPNYIAPNNIPNPKTLNITKVAVLENNGWEWKDINGLSQEQKPKTGDACLVLVNVTDGSIADAFVSPVFEINDIVYVTVNQDNSVNGNSALNSLVNQLDQISAGTLLGGLFVPYGDDSGAHFLYHETDSDDNDRHILHVKPLKPRSGSTLDKSEPENNVIDTDSKLDIRYGEMYLSTTANGDISINAGRDAVLRSDNYTGVNSAGIIEISADENINISSVNESVRITADENVEITSESTQIKLKSGSGVTSDNTITAKVNGVSNVYLGCPIGTIVMWTGTTVPEGWLLCNGEYVCLGTDGTVTHPEGHEGDVWYGTKYQYLINVISTIYGVIGNQYGTRYRLPDLQQRFPLGAKNDEFIDYQYIELTLVKNNTIPNLNSVKVKSDYKYSYIDSSTVLDLTNSTNKKTGVGNFYRVISVIRSGSTTPADYSSITVQECDEDGILLPFSQSISIFNLFSDGTNTLTTIKATCRYPTSIGGNGGELMHTLTIDEMPNHAHTVSIFSGDPDTSKPVVSDDNYTDSPDKTSSTSYVGGSEPHNNIPPYLAINFIIKYK